MATAGDGKGSLHIAMLPWLAFGHMLPFLELAKLLARRGHRVSYLSTPRNLSRLPPPPPDLSSLITFVPLPLPATAAAANLPPSAEATLDIPLSLVPLLKSAYDGLRDPVAAFLRSHSPDWIVQDFASYWLPAIAADLHISTAFFSTYGAWLFVFIGPSAPLAAGSDRFASPEDLTTPPAWVPFPSKLAFRPYEGKELLQGTAAAEKSPAAVTVSDFFRYGTTVAGCDVYCVRTCTELDGDWLRILGEINRRKIIPVGMMPPPQDHGDDDDTWRAVSGWLDRQEEGSVVYVAFGTEAALSQEEVTELALGLEMSGLPFFWVFRRPESSPVELPAGFEERVGGRGFVWTSWAPQLRILSHVSVGGFLNQCGWSSIIEGLQRGLPLIMLPFVWDQGLNARLLEEKEVGVEIPRGERDGSLSRDSVAESLRRVMLSEEGKVYKEKAKDWAKIVGDTDLQGAYVDKFVEHLENKKRGSN